MKENDNSKGEVRITEVGEKPGFETENTSKDKLQKLKKPIIFFLMAIVFAGCMYLIFVPSTDKKDLEQAGLNEAVPQATDAGMQADKGKAYESELLEQKELDKKKSLSTLSDYWNADSIKSQPSANNVQTNPVVSTPDHQNDAINSYRNIQGTLGSFYQDRGETTQLQNEVKSLKAQLAQREIPQTNPVESQLALMEKSYQMAAKYFPNTASKTEEKIGKSPNDTMDKIESKASANVYPAQKGIVSALYREPSDSALLAGLIRMDGRNFFTAGRVNDEVLQANSIRACIQETQIVTADNSVRIRLLDPIRVAKMVIPKGTVVTAIAKFQATRLQLQISSIEFSGNILPVDIMVYDLDGQPGLSVPYSPERNALTEVAANMGNTSGTSVSLSSTAGQQITSDLSKSLVQGVSGYFAKKVRTPKITLKAGYQLFLMAKK
ncbi:conjugative transposon protein TraM [Chryseobacterium sp. SIMBA_029]|uniref:conjugative transposon protein TraM n=1 Tax=Chryseobacterium sp. SIMBA_029 TaxID=3085772 RepID=UPI00397DF6DD